MTPTYPAKTKSAARQWTRLLTGAVWVCILVSTAFSAQAIPAAPVMTVYRFNGPTRVPYFTADAFARSKNPRPAGQLAQGSAVVPCVVVRNGRPLTNKSGTPFVGFDIIVDADKATPDSVAVYERAVAAREGLDVEHHHCSKGNPLVIDARRLFARDKAPWFDPPRPAAATSAQTGQSPRDAILRRFHASGHCARVNRTLLGRRDALDLAWSSFLASLPSSEAKRGAEAMHLDYVMRTAIYEGHIGRGCNAYGACERNVIALTIRNRAVERCQSGQGCRKPGDFQGVSSAVAQYNIWDELLTQTTGLTACFLRDDLASEARYGKLRAMYEQSAPYVEKILFGDDTALASVFPEDRLSQLKNVRHYYHPPAMSACFPSKPRIEYVSAAVASRGSRHALIINRRVRVDAVRGSGYPFRTVDLDRQEDRDVVSLTDEFAGFLIDARKIALRKPRRCTPYGTSTGCRHRDIGRHRKTPSWLRAGAPTRIRCHLESRGEDCDQPASTARAAVGGICDREMQPVAGVR